jgi:hypothetical protein
MRRFGALVYCVSPPSTVKNTAGKVLEIYYKGGATG